MAANDELPRGWSLSNSAIGAGTASITLPAIAGIAHVLTDVVATLDGGTALSTAVDILIDGVLTNTIILLTIPSVAQSIAQATWTGKIQGGLGKSLQVKFESVAPAADNELLTINGYDI